MMRDLGMKVLDNHGSNPRHQVVQLALQEPKFSTLVRDLAVQGLSALLQAGLPIIPRNQQEYMPEKIKPSR